MKAEKRLFIKQIKNWLISKFLVLLVRFISFTTSVKQINAQVLSKALQENDSVIFATWHQNIFFSIWLLREHKLTALISNSEDGEIICNVFKHFGYPSVRGSTTRGGIPALKQLINLLKEIFENQQFSLIFPKDFNFSHDSERKLEVGFTSNLHQMKALIMKFVQKLCNSPRKLVKLI